MTTYNEFEEYFEQLVQADPDLKSVTFVDDWNEILELQLSSDLYPALVIELPIVRFREIGGIQISFEAAFSIIHGMPIGEKRVAYRHKLRDLLVLAKKVHRQIFCDSEENDVFDAELDDTLDPITKATADNCYGWRGYVKLSDY